MTMWRRVQRLDRQLMRRSFGARSPALDRTLIATTRAANYSRLWLLVAGALAVFGGRRGRRAAGRGLIAIAIAAAVANGPAKLLVRRRRPSSRRGRAHPHAASTSFPSGHTAAAFAFVTGASADCRTGAGPRSVAGAVGYSACTPGFTTRVTWQPVRRSGSAPACSRRACRCGSADSRCHHPTAGNQRSRARNCPGRHVGPSWCHPGQSIQREQLLPATTLDRVKDIRNSLYLLRHV